MFGTTAVRLERRKMIGRNSIVRTFDGAVFINLDVQGLTRRSQQIENSPGFLSVPRQIKFLAVMAELRAIWKAA
jgi:hypothetical protein